MIFDISFNKFSDQGFGFIVENGIGLDKEGNSKLKEFNFKGN